MAAKKTVESNQEDYRGPERRRHKMYVTRNTEYHFRSGICVAVRDRRSGSWLPAHLALSRSLSGRVQFHKNGVVLPREGRPRIGDALYFEGEGRELVTSRLCDIGRPEKGVVSSYPERAPLAVAN